MSEGSGSAYNGSVYSPGAPNMGVRFAMSPDSPDRARERHITGSEEGPGQPKTNGRSGKKKGKGRDSSQYSYRDDSGYFEDENRWQQHSSGPAYATSAPAAVQGFASSQRPNEYGTYSASHDQFRHDGRHSSNYAIRSGPQTQYEESSQSLDVFSATSHYLREYSAGFVNGQAAALGVGPFASPPSQPMASAPGRTLTADNTGSIVYTSESMEDARQDTELSHSAFRSRSPSRSGHRSSMSQIINPQLASILSSPPRGHISLVSLPSVSSHGQPSPSLSSNQRHYTSSHSSSNILAREDDSPRQSVASSGLNPPPSLPHDPEAAAAMIADRFSMTQFSISGRVSPSNRSQRTSVSSGWGTVYSNARSNSLISGLRGLPVGQGDAYDNASVRTRATRFSMDLVDFGDRDSVRDSRRESHTSLGARNNMSEIEEEAREGSPVRPVHSMVGVLPLDDPSSSAVNRTGSNADASSHSQRSSTAVDRRLGTDPTVWGTFNSSHSSQSRHQSGGRHQSRQTESQEMAANNDWVSAQNLYESGRSSHSPHHNQVRVTSRSRERRSNRDDDDNRYRRPTTTQRSQTSMGVSLALSASGSSSWSEGWNTYQSHSSHSHNRSHEQISPTSQPSVVQPPLSTINSPPPSRLVRERDRDIDRERSTRSRTHGHIQSSNTRPSLLTTDSSSAFPVSIESTDDERHPRANHTRSRTAMNTNDGRSTRIGRHANSSSITISNSGTSSMAENNLSLQSFGTQNALGLELVTTANGISSPTPVSRTSTQGFLRSFSRGDT